jgi:hypothetical protein
MISTYLRRERERIEVHEENQRGGKRLKELKIGGRGYRHILPAHFSKSGRIALYSLFSSPPPYSLMSYLVV